MLGPLTIYTYGLMLAIGLAFGVVLLCLELRRKGLDAAHGIWIAVVAIPGGVIGARLLFVVEEWSRFIRDPIAVATSPGGLSFYGGLLIALLGVWVYVRRYSIPFLVFADAAAPGALLGRGIGRIGCHLSGDGDYGLPTALPWGTDYSHGIYPPSVALKRLPELARHFPGGVAPDDLPMHPTGVYEFVLCALVFTVLWHYRARMRRHGEMFMMFLLAMGGVRFILEFLALAPPVVVGLTEAQLISLGLIAFGALGLCYSGVARLPLLPVTRTR
jgi:phosphatidylglycerol:prolipoprotein diacylglycerol transferase